MPLKTGLSRQKTQSKQQPDQEQCDQERTQLREQQVSAGLWCSQQDIHAAAFLFPAHQAGSGQDGPEADGEWHEEFHETNGNEPLRGLDLVGIAYKTQELPQAAKRGKRRSSSLVEIEVPEHPPAHPP